MKLKPWEKTYKRISSRCAPSGNYGKRGIRRFITPKELKKLWFRDKAYLLKQPSIHRKEGTKNYTITNCKYVELLENKTDNYKRKMKPCARYDLDGKFIEKYKSLTEASKKNGITYNSIRNVSNSKKSYNTAAGFIWKFIK